MPHDLSIYAYQQTYIEHPCIQNPIFLHKTTLNFSMNKKSDANLFTHIFSRKCSHTHFLHDVLSPSFSIKRIILLELTWRISANISMKIEKQHSKPLVSYRPVTCSSSVQIASFFTSPLQALPLIIVITTSTLG